MNIDKKSLEKFIDGDWQAFTAMYSETKSFVYNVIYKLVMNIEEANDLTHDVFVKIYDKRSKFDINKSATTWLYKIATNHTLTHLRRKKWLLTKGPEIAFFYKNQLKKEHKKDSDNIAIKTLEKIKTKYRLPVILKDIDGLKYEEIANILNIKIGTVRSRLNRGRMQLKAIYLKEEG